MAGKSPRWSLHGMTALVTGGTRGIGRAIVEELSELGATIYTCSRKETDLNQLLKDSAAKGYQVTGSVCDVSSREQRTELMEKVSSFFHGKLNILVNNAGTSRGKPTADVTADDYSVVMSTNFESSYHFSQLPHPLMKASGAGNIVFISSIAGLVSVELTSVYGATKAAMNQLAKNLACEWAKDNIRVNSIAPNFIRTSMVEADISVKEIKERIESRTPMNRIREPEEVSSLGSLSVSSGSFLHHRPSYSCGWWIHCEWHHLVLITNGTSQIYSYQGIVAHPEIFLLIFSSTQICINSPHGRFLS